MKSIYVPMNGESGSSVGPNGRLQSRRINAELKRNFPNAEIDFHAGHYYCSAFIRYPDNKIVYLMTSDYRFSNQEFLVRTAKDMKDYTGGVNNNYVGFDKIISAINRLHATV